MTFSNFKLTARDGGRYATYRVLRGEVDVTTGVWRKKTARREVRCKGLGPWHFVDTGDLIPGIEIAPALRVWEAETGEDLGPVF